MTNVALLHKPLHREVEQLLDAGRCYGVSKEHMDIPDRGWVTEVPLISRMPIALLAGHQIRL
jgi:hypothetical protein